MRAGMKGSRSCMNLGFKKGGRDGGREGGKEGGCDDHVFDGVHGKNEWERGRREKQ